MNAEALSRGRVDPVGVCWRLRVGDERLGQLLQF